MVGWAIMKRRAIRSRRWGRRDDSGASLILAMVYIVTVGLIVGTLATWASNDLNNTVVFRGQASLDAAATGMTKLAIQYVRYNPLITNTQQVGVASPPVACWGGTDVTQIQPIDNDQVAVWCSTVWQPELATTRVVTFYACAISESKVACSSPGGAVLTTTVTYDDYPAGKQTAKNDSLCSSVLCGQGMTIGSWGWGPGASNSTVGVPATVSFTTEPSATSVGQPTTVDVLVLDASQNPVVGDTVTISAGGSGLFTPASVLTAVTNPSGVASFTDIDPATAGQFQLIATDGAVSQNSTYFAVGQGQSVVTPPAAPSSAIAPGSFVAVATTNSGDGSSIVVAGTAGICTASGTTVTFVGGGICVLTFTDPGNSNYIGSSATLTFVVTAQLSNPGIPTLAYGTSVGSIAVTFSAPSNAASGQTYTAEACTDVAMGQNCVNYPSALTSAGTFNFTGLTQGTNYYVGVTANASSGYLVSGESVSASSLNPTTQLSNPGTPTLAYGTSAGSIAVTFSAPANAAPGQTYTFKACTNFGMSSNCVTYPSPITSAGTSSFTGLPFTAGTAGTAYYVGVTANASSGYLVSGQSVRNTSQSDTSQQSTPVLTATTGSTSGKVALQITTASTPNGASYTCNAYTNAGLGTLVATGTCSTSGGNWAPSLTSGTTYYFTAIATPSSGNSSAYVTSAVSATANAKAK
jgi:hypothetical protein